MAERSSSDKLRSAKEETQRDDFGRSREDDPVLILGYGNVDRQDDGVAWHVLARLAQHLGYPFPSSPEEEIRPSHQNTDFLFVLQLAPELAETISQYRRVCFVDAHTGWVPLEIQVANLAAEFQSSPFTHHLTPSTCLALAQSLYHSQPEAILVSVRGYEFGFSRSLSKQTSALAEQAAGQILAWFEQPSFREEGEP